jgi:small subunit ribosomal protein S17e
LGRIKAKFLKTMTTELLERHPGKFDTDFEKNKQAVQELAEVPSKKLRNIIAGYATRLKKAGKYQE